MTIRSKIYAISIGITDRLGAWVDSLRKKTIVKYIDRYCKVTITECKDVVELTGGKQSP